jgi:dihydroflavonol-4-reductase
VLAAADELDVVVASPAVVFGPAPMGSNSMRFLERVVRGRLGPLSPPGSLSVVGLADAADGILLALRRGIRARRYLLCESAWRLHDLFRLASRLAGRSGPRIRLNGAAWRSVVATLELVDRWFLRGSSTPEALELLGYHFRFKARRAREELGWTPRPIDQVLAETLAWLGGGAGKPRA